MPNLRLAPQFSRKSGWDKVGYLLEKNASELWFVSDYFGQWTDFLIYGETWSLDERSEVAKSIDELPIAIPSTFILWSE